MPLKFIQFFSIPHRKLSALVLSFLYGAIYIELLNNNAFIKTTVYFVNFLITYLILEIIYQLARKHYRPDFLEKKVKMKFSVQEAMSLGSNPGRWNRLYDKEEYALRYEWGLMNATLILGGSLYLFFIIIVNWGYMIFFSGMQYLRLSLNFNLLPYSIGGFIAYTGFLYNINQYFYYRKQQLKGEKRDAFALILIFSLILMFCLAKFLFFS